MIPHPTYTEHVERLWERNGQAPASEHRLEIQFKPGDEPGRAVLTAVVGGATVHLDTVKVESAISRGRFLGKLAAKVTSFDRDAVEQRLMEIADELGTMAAETARHTRERPAVAALQDTRDAETCEQLESMEKSVVAEAEEMLADPRLGDRLLLDFEAAGIVGEELLACTVYMLGTSRLLDKPLAAITQGVTSSGKSYVQEMLAKMFPPESVLLATDITTNALYYLNPGALMHQFVVAGERSRRDDDDRAEATRALREMISAGEIRKMVPTKDPGGGMSTRVIWQPGPIAFIESTTLAKVFDEDANRCILLGTDESQEQTTRIVLAQAARAAGERTDPRGVLDRHHAIQRLLRRCKVVVPFAKAIGAAIPTHRQDARRAMPQIISMVSAVSLFYQRQRSSEALCHGSVIHATLDDYAFARDLLQGPMGRSLGGSLPEAVVRFGQRLRENFGHQEFTSAEAGRDDSAVHSRSKANEYLNALEDGGFSQLVTPSRGKQPAIWKMVGDVPEPGAEWLPSVSTLKEATS